LTSVIQKASFFLQKTEPQLKVI